MITRESIDRPGGEQWHRYDLRDGFAITTGSLASLISEHRAFHGEMNSYRRQLVAAQAGSLAAESALYHPNRTYVAEGGDGTVYAIGNKLAVKEAKPWSGKSFLEYFERMENLRVVIQEHLPHWVSTPANYGLYVSEDEARQYLLMQQIGGGITLEDIHKPGRATAFKRDKLARLRGSLSVGTLGELDDRLHETHMKLVGALRAEGLRYDEYLQDWGPHNVIVERLENPIADSRFKLWIIDQQ